MIINKKNTAKRLCVFSGFPENPWWLRGTEVLVYPSLKLLVQRILQSRMELSYHLASRVNGNPDPGFVPGIPALTHIKKNKKKKTQLP